MLTAVILFGLILGGAVVAVGWLHWRGRLRFGRRQANWGIGTMLIGLIQVVVWAVFPGGPDLWLRLGVALAGAVLFALWLLWRQGPAGSSRPPAPD